MDSTLLQRRINVSQPRKPYQVLKRVVEWLFFACTLPITLPIMSLCALCVWLDSPGPAIFEQKRVGKDGKVFTIYKFRTMVHNHDARGEKEFMDAFIRGEMAVLANKATSQNDNPHTLKEIFARLFGKHESIASTVMFKPFRASAITRVGRVLRKTSLDELPQIFNILLGDMSLIGPRPNVVTEVEAYKPEHYRRLEVLPGITGLAQVRGRSCICFEDIVKHDVEYIENESLWMDLRVLWQTVSTVLFGKGAK